MKIIIVLLTFFFSSCWADNDYLDYVLSHPDPYPCYFSSFEPNEGVITLEDGSTWILIDEYGQRDYSQEKVVKSWEAHSRLVFDAVFGFGATSQPRHFRIVNLHNSRSISAQPVSIPTPLLLSHREQYTLSSYLKLSDGSEWELGKWNQQFAKFWQVNKDRIFAVKRYQTENEYILINASVRTFQWVKAEKKK